MIKDQFITRYATDIAQIFSVFNELQFVHNNNFVLYYDGKTWEIFDMYLGVTPIRHEARHVLQLIQDIKTLTNDIVNVHLIGTFNRNFHKQSQTISLKHLKQLYPDQWSYFLPKNYKDGKEH